MTLTFVSERLSPDEALDKIAALSAPLPEALYEKVGALCWPWPPEDPLSRGLDAIELTSGAAKKHVDTLWRIALTFLYLKAWCDYHAGATDERANAKGSR